MSQMTIGKRLMIGFGAVLAVALGLAGSGIYWVGSLGHHLDMAVNSTTKKVFLLTELQADIHRLRTCQRGVMLFAMHNVPDKVRANKEEFEQKVSASEQLLRDVKPLLVSDDARRLIAEMEPDLVTLNGYFQQVASASMSG